MELRQQVWSKALKDYEPEPEEDEWDEILSAFFDLPLDNDDEKC